MMRSPLLYIALALALLAVTHSHAQEVTPPPATPAVPPATLAIPKETEDPEVTRLRTFLKAKPEVKIQPSDNPTIRAVMGPAPLKVAIATGLDMDVRRNFLRFVEEWQKKDAKKYGAIEVVKDFKDADIILVRYAMVENSYESSYSAEVPVAKWDKQFHMTTELKTHTVSDTLVPTFGYVIQPNGEEMEILYRYASPTLAGIYKTSGSSIWDALKYLMKDRFENTKKNKK